jgi:hypothetical protein
LASGLHYIIADGRQKAGRIEMSNDEMKAGRFLKLSEGRKMYNAIISHLQSGGSVLICTYTKATKFTAKHTNMFKLGKSGSVYMQRGKNWDCIDYVGVKYV